MQLCETPSAGNAYYERIAGAVLFDSNGLPQEYFTALQSQDISWEQAVFQVLGLRWLLMSSLQLEGFNYAKVSCNRYLAFVLRRRDYYMALLFRKPLDSALTDADSPPEFVNWLRGFEVQTLRTDPRFQNF